MNALHAAALTYRLLLRLYPQDFRAAFAQEMEGVFSDALAAAAGQGPADVFQLCLGEWLTLPLTALREHIDERTYIMNSVSPFEKQRRLLRAASLLISAFLLVCSLLIVLVMTGFTLQYLVVLIFVFHAIMLAALLIAFRWERAGGIVVLTSAGTLGAILLAIFFPSGLAGAALLSGLWLLPYIVLGILYVLLSRRVAAVAHAE